MKFNFIVFFKRSFINFNLLILMKKTKMIKIYVATTLISL